VLRRPDFVLTAEPGAKYPKGHAIGFEFTWEDLRYRENEPCAISWKEKSTHRGLPSYEWSRGNWVEGPILPEGQWHEMTHFNPGAPPLRLWASSMGWGDSPWAEAHSAYEGAHARRDVGARATTLRDQPSVGPQSRRDLEIVVTIYPGCQFCPTLRARVKQSIAPPGPFETTGDGPNWITYTGDDTDMPESGYVASSYTPGFDHQAYLAWRQEVHAEWAREDERLRSERG
jgi:hypothetical protein